MRVIFTHTSSSEHQPGIKNQTFFLTEDKYEQKKKVWQKDEPAFRFRVRNATRSKHNNNNNNNNNNKQIDL